MRRLPYSGRRGDRRVALRPEKLGAAVRDGALGAEPVEGVRTRGFVVGLGFLIDGEAVGEVGAVVGEDGVDREREAIEKVREKAGRDDGAAMGVNFERDKAGGAIDRATSTKATVAITRPRSSASGSAARCAASPPRSGARCAAVPPSSRSSATSRPSTGRVATTLNQRPRRRPHQCRARCCRLQLQSAPTLAPAAFAHFAADADIRMHGFCRRLARMSPVRQLQMTVFAGLPQGRRPGAEPSVAQAATGARLTGLRNRARCLEIAP
jgi:hypothetical protein